MLEPRYEGDYVEGVEHGRGTFTFADGSTYEGDYVTGEMHGRGKYTVASGDVYHDGHWENGKPTKAEL